MWTHTSFPELAVKRNKTGDWVLTMAATGRARKKAPPASDHAKDMLRDLGSRAFPTLRNAVRALEAHDAVRDSG
jgi:hypothetical protein